MTKSNLLLFLCTLLAIQSIAQNGDYSFKEEYDINSPASLKVVTNDGNIDIKPGSSDKMEVHFIVRQKGRLLDISREELDEDIELIVVRSNNTLSISAKDRRPQNWTRSKNVSIRVYAPKRTTCELYTSDGNIDIRGMEGDQKLKTSDGNIDASDIGGEVYAKTSDGNIVMDEIDDSVEVITSDGNIQARRIRGAVDLSTSDGNITVVECSGKNKLKTSDGSISFDRVNGSLSAVTSDGNIRGTLDEVRDEIYMRTSDGTIDITVPDGIGLDLDLRADKIKTSLRNFDGTSRERSINGRLNNGGISVDLVASGGTIILSYE